MCLYCAKEIPREKHNLLSDDNNTTIFTFLLYKVPEALNYILTAGSLANVKNRNFSISWFTIQVLSYFVQGKLPAKTGEREHI